MERIREYRYHLAALFTVTVWGATFVSTKVLIANSLTPAEIFFLRFALAYLCIWPLTLGRGGKQEQGVQAGCGDGSYRRQEQGVQAENGHDAYAKPRTGGQAMSDVQQDVVRQQNADDRQRVTISDAQVAGSPAHARQNSILWAATLWDELMIAAAGVTGGSLYFLAENMALEYAPASNVSLIVCTAPVWTAVLLSLIYRSERMTGRQITGTALAFAGMVLVVLNGHFVLRLSPAGDLLALGAALLWMFYSLLIKRLGGRYPSVFITRKLIFYGLLTILPVFLVQPPAFDAAVLLRPVVWGNLLFLGVVASMICYVLWNAAMYHLGAVRTTNYIYLNPLVTILTAALFIGERITLAALAGAALILYGMWRAETK